MMPKKEIKTINNESLPVQFVTNKALLYIKGNGVLRLYISIDKENWSEYFKCWQITTDEVMQINNAISSSFFKISCDNLDKLEVAL